MASDEGTTPACTVTDGSASTPMYVVMDGVGWGGGLVPVSRSVGSDLYLYGDAIIYLSVAPCSLACSLIDSPAPIMQPAMSAALLTTPSAGRGRDLASRFTSSVLIEGWIDGWVDDW